MSSRPARRVWRLRTSCGSKLASRSRGVLTSTSRARSRASWASTRCERSPRPRAAPGRADSPGARSARRPARPRSPGRRAGLSARPGRDLLRPQPRSASCNASSGNSPRADRQPPQRNSQASPASDHSHDLIFCLVIGGFPGPKGRVGHPDLTQNIGQNRAGPPQTASTAPFTACATCSPSCPNASANASARPTGRRSTTPPTTRRQAAPRGARRRARQGRLHRRGEVPCRRPRRARRSPALPRQTPPPVAIDEPARTLARRGQTPHQGDRPLPRRDQLPDLVWAVLTSTSPTPRTASASASSNASACAGSETREANQRPTRRPAPHRLTTTGNRSHGEFTAAKRRDPVQRETTGMDDTQSSAPAPSSRLLSAEERACSPQEHGWTGVGSRRPREPHALSRATRSRGCGAVAAGAPSASARRRAAEYLSYRADEAHRVLATVRSLRKWIRGHPPNAARRSSSEGAMFPSGTVICPACSARSGTTMAGSTRMTV